MESPQARPTVESREARRLILFSSVILGANVAFSPLFLLNTDLPWWTSVSTWLTTTLVTTETLWELDDTFADYSPDSAWVGYLIVIYNLLHVGLSLAVLLGGETTVYEKWPLAWFYAYLGVFFVMSLLHGTLSLYWRKEAQTRESLDDANSFFGNMLCDGFAILLDLVLLGIVTGIRYYFDPQKDWLLIWATFCLVIFTVVEYLLYPAVEKAYLRQNGKHS